LKAGACFIGEKGSTGASQVKPGVGKTKRIRPRYKSNPYNIPHYSLSLGCAMGDLLFKLKGDEKRGLELEDSEVHLEEGSFSPLNVGKQ